MVSIVEVSAKGEFHLAKDWFEKTGNTDKLEAFFLESEYIPREARVYIVGVLNGSITRPKKPTKRDYEIMAAYAIFERHVKNVSAQIEYIKNTPSEVLLTELDGVFPSTGDADELKKQNLKKLFRIQKKDFYPLMVQEFGLVDEATAKAAFMRAEGAIKNR